MGRRATVSTKLADELASQIASNPESFPEFSWDNAITGFGIRRYPSGKVSWIIKVKTKVKVLGRVGELSEVEARIKALMIIKDGVPAPQPEIQPTPPKYLTVEYCFGKAIKSPKFLEGRAVKTQTTTCRYLHEILALLPSLAKKNFADLKTSDLIDIKSHFEDKGASSQNNILLAVKQVWDFYRFHDSEVQKVVGDLPAMSLAGLKERRKPRTDRLTAEQLKTVYVASERLGNPYQTAFIKLSILTCRRNQTVTHMRWDDLDLEKGLWIIPPEFNKKGRGQSFGREEWIPLTDTMIKVINAVPCQGPFVIGGKTPITAGSKLLVKIKKLSEIEVDDRGNSWTFHGFRRSMASSSMGALNTRVIDLIQGRVETGAAAHYYQGQYLDAKLKGLCEWELIVLEDQVEHVDVQIRRPENYTRRSQGASPIWEVAFRLLWLKYRKEKRLNKTECTHAMSLLYPRDPEAYSKINQNAKKLLEGSPLLRAWSDKSLTIEELEDIVKSGNRYRNMKLSELI
ncbi:MAG: Uncharacterised protein [Gammaproteobacteria bacterium]|nr:MAG: Uncharacterised protein [Gammaproteobacteria bacterium]